MTERDYVAIAAELADGWRFVVPVSAVLIVGAYIELFVLGVWADTDACCLNELVFLRSVLVIGWVVAPLSVLALMLVGMITRSAKK